MGNNFCCFKQDPYFVHPSSKKHQQQTHHHNDDDYMYELTWNEELNDWESVR